MYYNIFTIVNKYDSVVVRVHIEQLWYMIWDFFDVVKWIHMAMILICHLSMLVLHCHSSIPLLGKITHKWRAIDVIVKSMISWLTLVVLGTSKPNASWNIWHASSTDWHSNNHLMANTLCSIVYRIVVLRRLAMLVCKYVWHCSTCLLTSHCDNCFSVRVKVQFTSMILLHFIRILSHSHTLQLVNEII